MAEFIHRGAEGDDVVLIQRALQQLDFDVSDDGIFGEATEQAITSFQRSKGLTDDGAVGQPTLDALGLGDKIILFPPQVVPNSVATNIKEYIERFDRQFSLSINNSDRALNQFQTTMSFASTSEAKADILGAMGDAAVAFATDKLIDSVGELTAGMGSKLINAVRDEVRRASAAAESATIGDWIKAQRTALGKALNSFQPTPLQIELETDFLEATDQEQFLENLFIESKGLAAFRPPSVEDLELILYEKWINAHFRAVTGDGPGCIVFRYELENDEFEFISCTVNAAEGSKVASALNRLIEGGLTTLAERPIDLFVRKRACFRTEGPGGGTRFFCGWLDIKNEILHDPASNLAQRALRKEGWRRHPAFD